MNLTFVVVVVALTGLFGLALAIPVIGVGESWAKVGPCSPLRMGLLLLLLLGRPALLYPRVW